MQLLPLMLQAALFFLGFAVPLSLVDINTTIAFVALGLTSFGVLFHISLVIVRAADKSCPYQTSASYLLRHLRPQFPSIVHSLKVNNQLHLTRVFLGLDENTHLVDLQCVSWILWTSLDKTVHLSTLRHLLSIPTLDGIEPTLALTCFYIFTSCAGLRNNRVVIVQGWEQLAMVSARCLFRTLEHHFSSTDPRTPSVLEDLRRRYNRVFPFNADFRGLPYYFTMVRIHAWAHRHQEPRDVRWDNYTPPAQEHIPFARHMVEVAQEEYQGRKVPCWILRFAMHSLSQDPPSPASVIADCLKIVAIDLDLDASKITVLNERERVDYFSSWIIQRIRTMVEANDPAPILFKCKTISALVPHAVFLGRLGQQEMVDAISLAVKATTDGRFIWRCIWPYTATFFAEPNPPSVNLIVTLASPYMLWDKLQDGMAVARWADAASEVPYTEQVGQNVAEALLQIVAIDSLRPHIPLNTWALLNNNPPLPPGLKIPRYSNHTSFLFGRSGTTFSLAVKKEMEISIREDFRGTNMECHRIDLIDRLEHILGQLDQGLDYFNWHHQMINEYHVLRAKREYGKLREVLREVHEGQ
ncbi:hypothetical protein BJ322DRAFT_1111457 [Thelephora terrestris]|uniref:Uncharacterized protein n=1 Tax=Thelephora terrestris TaxID=56493 RepID=A0A9P6H845_9AGAM|nr:hypothetical protein BJ322DRAFT_1111457 [Thelephora terrestris]